jgi:hypothetical protein
MQGRPPESQDGEPGLTTAKRGDNSGILSQSSRVPNGWRRTPVVSLHPFQHEEATRATRPPS